MIGADVPDGAVTAVVATVIGVALTGLITWASWMTRQAMRLTELLGRLEERQLARDRDDEDRDRRIAALESLRLTPAERRPR